MEFRDGLSRVKPLFRYPDKGPTAIRALSYYITTAILISVSQRIVKITFVSIQINIGNISKLYRKLKREFFFSINHDKLHRAESSLRR